ncbi:MAG: fluoride exporter [Thermoplasmata archaeon]|jgi:CrcB protein|nr:fluoride exporter [Thermoplasmata archaeon]
MLCASVRLAPRMADWSWRAAALVALGGAAGCVLRYLVGVWLTRDDFPWGTVAVNLLGSFVIGVLMFGAIQQGWLGPDARLLLVTGVLGGFTTMSSFAYETSAFLDDGETLRAVGYATLTVAGSLGMALLGRAVALAIPAAR